MKFSAGPGHLWLLLCTWLLLVVAARAQRVALRNPGSLEPGSVTTFDSQSKVSAKPGDVLVHFDRKNEIQQIQYVLRDGRLATLYHRKPTDFYGGKPVDPAPNAISFIHRRSEQPTSYAGETGKPVAPIGLPTSDSAAQDSSKIPATIQTSIDSSGQGPTIMNLGLSDPVFGPLNNKLASLPHFNSDKPVTVVVPDRKIFPMNVDLSQFPVAGLPLSDKMDILVTVASDAAQATAPLRKAMMDKLRNKVSQKIRELPGIIEAKLRAKSSVGHLILEKATSRYVPIVEGKINQPLPAIGSKLPKFIRVVEPLTPVDGTVGDLSAGKTSSGFQYPAFVQPSSAQQSQLSNQVLSPDNVSR